MKIAALAEIVSRCTMSSMSRTPFLLLLGLTLSPAAAQSFDCHFAHSPREQAICADTRLQALDAELAAGYKSLRAQLSPSSAALVQSDQNEWLHWIDLVCPAHGKGSAANQTQCLTQQYFTRAHDLEHTTRVGSTVIFCRSHFLYKPGATATTNPIDPGFGYGSLRWPQIDKPTSAQSTWNTAAKTRAASLAIDFNREKSPTDATATFSTAVNPYGVIDAYYTIEAANNRLISTTFTDGDFHWGAAHPVAQSTSFLWWLDRNRELTPADVFLPSSNWRQQLAPLATTSLQSNTNLTHDLWKGDQLQKGVQQAIAAAPRNWTLTRDGLTLTFAQYAVGPYFIGMPTALIPWTQLTPFLAPTLNPSTLPPPTPKPNR